MSNRKSIKKIIKAEGVLFPSKFNSDSKAIEFTLHSPDGHIYLLQCDHLMTRMRKFLYQMIYVRGEVKKRKDETIVLVREVFTLERGGRNIHPYATSLYERDLTIYEAS